MQTIRRFINVKGELIASGDLADSILSHLKAEIEKVENPYKDEISKSAQRYFGFNNAIQSILKLLDDKNKEN